MDDVAAITRLTALANPHRLRIFRLLIAALPDGLCASDLAARLDLAPATLSFHLKELTRAQLLQSRQQGRFVFYSAEFEAMNALMAYLTDHCCHAACAAEYESLASRAGKLVAARC